MAINTTAIFTGVPDIQWGTADGNGGTAGPLKTANTAYDGTGTVLTVFTANATNGGFVKCLRVKPVGSNTGTVLRIFINNGSANSVAGNNIFFREVSMPTTTLSEVDVTYPTISIPLNFVLPAGYKINVTLGTTVA